MMLVYRTDKNGIWTGASREIGPKDGDKCAAQLDPEMTIRWKTAGGDFVMLDAAQIEA